MTRSQQELNERLFKLIQTEENPIKAVKGVIKDGADIDARDDFGATPLMRAAESEEKEILKYLLREGADVSLEDEDGLTALDYAMEDEIAQILEEAGGDYGNDEYEEDAVDDTYREDDVEFDEEDEESFG
jgi:hypothetical protein